MKTFNKFIQEQKNTRSSDHDDLIESKDLNLALKTLDSNDFKAVRDGYFELYAGVNHVIEVLNSATDSALKQMKKIIDKSDLGKWV